MDELVIKAAQLQLDLVATEQALSATRAELENARPVADAAHAYCAAWEYPPCTELGRALFAAHEATTPSPTPSSHVIVERAELQRLQAIAVAAADWAANKARSAEFLRGTSKALYVTVRGES